MIDNIELIKPFLKFESVDDFYYLQILQRKKENSELGSKSRVIKNYYIKSVKELEDKYEEIKKLCIFFNARASIRLNKRSFEKIAFQSLTNISNVLSNREYRFVNKCYDKACGTEHNDKNKKWILDIDKDSTITIIDIKKALANIQPLDSKKLIALIPSRTGYHVITSPFNVMEFNKFISGIDIHKDNPTNLFIP